MTRFAESLRKAREQLDLPEPARSRILLEMAADLEDSYRLFREQGLDEEQAVRRAEEAFATSEESLEQLARLHHAGRELVGDRLSGQVGSWWEKTLLVALVLFELGLAARLLAEPAFFRFLSPFVWPIAGLAIAAFGVTIWKLRQIFSHRGVEARRVRDGVGSLLFFAGASLATAGCGFLFHLQRFLRASAADAPEAVFVNFAGWALGISSLMTVGLLTAFFSALIWFVLNNLAARGELREAEALLAGA